MGMDPERRKMCTSVVMLLVQHPKSKPIKAEDAGKALGMAESTFRELAAFLTCKGNPIVSGTNGFYWTNDADEMRKKRKHLCSRRNALSVHIKGVDKAIRILQRKHASPPRCDGQLDLEDMNVQNQ